MENAVEFLGGNLAVSEAGDVVPAADFADDELPESNERIIGRSTLNLTASPISADGGLEMAASNPNTETAEPVRVDPALIYNSRENLNLVLLLNRGEINPEQDAVLRSIIKSQQAARSLRQEAKSSRKGRAYRDGLIDEAIDGEKSALRKIYDVFSLNPEDEQDVLRASTLRSILGSYRYSLIDQDDPREPDAKERAASDRRD